MTANSRFTIKRRDRGYKKNAGNIERMTKMQKGRTKDNCERVTKLQQVEPKMTETTTFYPTSQPADAPNAGNCPALWSLIIY